MALTTDPVLSTVYDDIADVPAFLSFEVDNLADLTPTYTNLLDVASETMSTSGFKYEEFVLVRDLQGNALSITFDSIDTVTYNALNSAADKDAILTAWQGLTNLILNLVGVPAYGKAYVMEIRVDTTTDTVVNTGSNATVVVTSDFMVTYDNYLEFTVNTPDIYVEFLSESYLDIYTEFTVNTPDIYVEATIEPYSDIYVEFDVNTTDLYLEFTVTPEEYLIERLQEEIVVSDDCGTVTINLEDVIDEISTEPQTVVVYRGTDDNIVSDTDYVAGTTVYTFPTTQDGLYFVELYISTGLFARRAYMIDCRTVKCLNRISEEDVLAFLEDDGCEQNPDWEIIFTLWIAAKYSFGLSNYTDINSKFDRIKRYCRECKQSNCGC